MLARCTQYIKDNALFKSSAVLFAGTMIANVLNYLFHFSMGRMVSVEAFGEIESLISVAMIIMVPAMALALAATKYSAHTKADDDKEGGREIFWYLHKKVLFIGFPVFIVLFLTTPFVAQFLHIQNYLAVALLWVFMFLSFLGAITSGILTGWQRFKSVGWHAVGGAAAKLLVGVVLVGIGLSVSGAIGGLVIGVLAAYMISLYMLRFLFAGKRSTKQEASSIDIGALRNYILPAFIGTLSITLLGNIDMVMAKHHLDVTIAGQYGALTIVSKVIFFGTSIIATVLFALSAESHHKKASSLKRLYYASGFIGVLSVFAVGAYFLFPEFILSLLFGDAYSAGAAYMGWFAIMVVLYSYSNLFMRYLLSVKRTRIVYMYLLLAIGETCILALYGGEIRVIISIVIGTQVLAIFTSIFFLFSARKEEIKTTTALYE